MLQLKLQYIYIHTQSQQTSSQFTGHLSDVEKIALAALNSVSLVLAFEDVLLH